jgi:intracellular septation protein
LNLYVAFHFSESTWVNFKLFGMLGLTVVFALLQGLWLARKVEQMQPSGGAPAQE